jgi:hypothetical protein
VWMKVVLMRWSTLIPRLGVPPAKFIDPGPSPGQRLSHPSIAGASAAVPTRPETCQAVRLMSGANGMPCHVTVTVGVPRLCQPEALMPVGFQRV